LSGKTSTQLSRATLPKRSKRQKVVHHVKFNLPLHPGQQQVGRHPARFKVVGCGRQWGKTRLGAPLGIRAAAEGKWGWWIAPDFPLAKVAWRILKMLAAQFGDLAEIKEAEKRIEFVSGGFIEVKSAHTDASLRSAVLDFLIVDEAAFVAAERWTSELRATIAIRKGWALFLSTFNGENWFYDLYERGKSDDHPDWMSWRHKSIENPHFTEEELEEARRTTPEAEFQQEYEANPLVYVGAVFPGEKVQVAADRGKAGFIRRPGLETYAGLDWGYSNATVFEVNQEDAEGRVDWFDERIWVATQLDTRVGAIVELCRQYDVEVVYADAAGADENAKLADALEDQELRTELVAVPFGKFKVSGIKTRRWYLENDLESMGAVPELIRTTKRYRYKEGSEDVVKEDDHPVDAATAFYASRRSRLVEDR
jgi:Terminase large subunit, T4likevirus-type, N-terminal